MTVFTHRTMGTVVSLDVRSPDSDDAVARAFGIFDAADARFSPFRADSELARLARGELGFAESSEEMREVLALGSAFERASGGAFSLHPAGALDANGVVKGWAAQRAADALTADGVGSFCLNAGGDVVARGVPEVDRRWQAGIRHPQHPDRLLGVVLLDDSALATSGAYERGAHITDGRSGAAASQWESVTVLDRDLTVADALATAVFAMGPDGPGWAEAEFGASVIALDAAGALTVAGPVDWARG